MPQNRDKGRLVSLVTYGTKTLCDYQGIFRRIVAFKTNAKRRTSDLEHWALVAHQETENGFVRTEEAEKLSQRFDEVMVDVYRIPTKRRTCCFRNFRMRKIYLWWAM
ncbi:MAG: hypothetical protein ACLR13_06940 [Acutalibacteraceae bacterium]